MSFFFFLQIVSRLAGLVRRLLPQSTASEQLTNKVSSQTSAKTDELPELSVQSGHQGVVLVTAVAGNGLSATAGADGTVKIWDEKSSQLLRTLRVSQYWVYLVVFSPDDTLLAAGSGDNTVRVWNTATWRQLHEFTGHSHAVKQLATTFTMNNGWPSTCRAFEFSTSTNRRRSPTVQCAES